MSLATLPAEVCPECEAPLASETVHQLALVRHGGYGGTQSTTVDWCSCGWTLERAVGTTSPRGGC
jgi:hypothetical protein